MLRNRTLEYTGKYKEMAEYHKDQKIEVLADLLEVIYAATEARGFSVEELENM